LPGASEPRLAAAMRLGLARRLRRRPGLRRRSLGRRWRAHRGCERRRQHAWCCHLCGIFGRPCGKVRIAPHPQRLYTLVETNSGPS